MASYVVDRVAGWQKKAPTSGEAISDVGAQNIL